MNMPKLNKKFVLRFFGGALLLLACFLLGFLWGQGRYYLDQNNRTSCEAASGSDLLESAAGKLRPGMSYQKIIETLGVPELSKEGEKVRVLEYYKDYGWRSSEGDDDSNRLRLLLKDDALVSVTDPYGFSLPLSEEADLSIYPQSTDYSRTSPDLIYPKDGASFDHSPRYIDFRWMPSGSGDAETYLLDVDIKHPEEWFDAVTKELKVSSYSDIWMGKNRGRWRVKIVNSKKDSEWSPFYYFEFTR